METIKSYYLETSWGAANAIDKICKRYDAIITHLKIAYNYISVEFNFPIKYTYKIEKELAPLCNIRQIHSSRGSSYLRFF